MTYDEAMDLETIVSRDDARREIKRHGLLWDDFVREYGNSSYYRACDVLAWLGY